MKVESRLAEHVWDYLKSNPNRAAQAVAALATIAYGYWFLTPSSATGLREQDRWLILGRVFLVAVVWLLTSAYAVSRRGARDFRRWLPASIVTAVLAVAAISGYDTLAREWTDYNQRSRRRVLIGSEFTEKIVRSRIEEAKLKSDRTISWDDAVRELHQTNPDDLLNAAGGVAESVWTWRSLFYRKLFLAFLYLAGLPLLCLALICAIQTAFCNRDEAPTVPGTDSPVPTSQPAPAAVGLLGKVSAAVPEGEAARRTVAENRYGDVFISYSRRDQIWLKRLRAMFRPLERDAGVSAWDDTRLNPGADWYEGMVQAIRSAKVAVLLVSPNFLASDFIVGEELHHIIREAEQRGLKIIWVPLSTCLYEKTPISRYQAAYPPDKPLDKLTPARRNEALSEVCVRIAAAIDR